MENSPELQPEEPSHEIQTNLPIIVIFGSGLKFQNNEIESKAQSLALTIEGKMRVLAAGTMFAEGSAGEIIFSGGKTFGKDRPSEAKAMKEYLLKKFPEIPEESITLDEQSHDTSESAENITRLLKEDNRPVIVLTNESHLPRVEKLFKNYGAKIASGATAEEKIKDRSPHHQKFLRRYFESGGAKNLRRYEKILRGLLYLDPKGLIPRRLARKRRQEK